MINQILDKTDKGREEIATRKHHLAPRLRSLLVLIDGKHTTADLLVKVAGLGLNEQSVDELVSGGFVHFIGEAAPAAAAPSDAKAAAEPESLTAIAQPQAEVGPILAEGETQFEALYHFYTETIKGTIGLRGYGLQLKVERASTIDDFRELRQPYIEAVLKAKGNEVANSLKSRLDLLLNLSQSPPQ